MTTTATRQTEQGNTIDAGLLQAFLCEILLHDAVTDRVNDLLFEHVAEGKYHPSVISASLRPIITELLDAATDEDWRVVRDDLVGDAREALDVDEAGSAAGTATPAAVQMIPLCDCTGEQLERGGHCDSPDCPNAPTRP